MNLDVTMLDKLPELISGLGGAIKGVLVGVGGTYYQPLLMVGALVAGYFVSKAYVPSRWGTAALIAGIVYCAVALS